MDKRKKLMPALAMVTLTLLFYSSTALPQDSCIVADNGTGTVDLPADCPFYAPDEPMYITDGLPPGDTLKLQPILEDFFCNEFTPCSLSTPLTGCEGAGGLLGGNYECFESTLDLVVTGTGGLTGFNRHLAVAMSCEIHTSPRNPGDSIQTMAGIVYRLEGELFGDPDFCTLIVTAGAENDLPGSGEIEITDIGGGLYNIDSFFDITYQIEFEGCPGSPLSDYSGTTTETIRLQQGVALPPTTGTCCTPEGVCLSISEALCLSLNGIFAGEGDQCLGDGDGDGYDDLCYEQGICLAPDNGTGTADLPADCPFYAPYKPMKIINGLPPGTTIELVPRFYEFFCSSSTACSLPTPPSACEGAGGSLGGNYECFEGTLRLDVSGTGSLQGFNRTLWVPVSCEIHTSPRIPNDSIQTMSADIYRFRGQLFGDPDFCEFIITAGTDYGLPGPGQITLTDLDNGYYQVDSFFDITYQIRFTGCPASVLEDYSGTTIDSVHLQQGPPPPTGACCLPDGSCIEETEVGCWGIGTYQGDGTVCLGDGNGDGVDDACPVPPYCVAVDNGTGTVDLPADCPFYAPDEPMYIVEGFPPGDTLKLQPILEDFFCNEFTPCSLSTPLTGCEGAGGLLGGNYECFESTLDLVVTGTGSLAGFNRHLAVPMSCEIHTSPRNPGDSIQTMAGIVYRLEGQLFGDPDFCELIVTAGTENDLPGSGEIEITDIGGGLYNIDSFFDITYQIEFEGCPASPLSDYSGTTSETIRLQQGAPQPPTTGACCTPEGICLSISEPVCLSFNGDYNGDGSECLGDIDDDGYDDLCYEPWTCIAPDNGTGTVDLPVECPYYAPLEPMNIINGLPPGTTIELVPTFYNFVCDESTSCSLPMPGVGCEGDSGSLNGNYHCFEGSLRFDVSGTGELAGFNRVILVPVSCEIHTGPRSPGDPVQSFAADMRGLFGELFGDPDFCEFVIIAGTDSGLSSPGHIVLTDLGNGLYEVDSFFDITYQIDFTGCPMSVLDSYSGTTVDSIRWIQGNGTIPEPIPTLNEWGMLILGLLLLAAGTVAVIRRRKMVSRGIANK
ncbi:MAG: IPTL-CTERM sorting domain-containing protein [Candidatus Zixiibacteriota bacterium]|nr:MAG: IPTL-CTERM sorting domain-containing protein [candidate division Zixibacteria bacterium]